MIRAGGWGSMFLDANHTLDANTLTASGNAGGTVFGLALTMEWCAKVQWHCMAAGKMNVLSGEEMQIAMEHYKTYGQKKSDGTHTQGYSGV